MARSTPKCAGCANSAQLGSQYCGPCERALSEEHCKHERINQLNNLIESIRTRDPEVAEALDIIGRMTIDEHSF